jgi:prephenate dehydrogenase
MLFDQITIVGVGLIGGSVGLAAKAAAVAGRVVGVDRDPNSLATAQRVGAIDSGTRTSRRASPDRNSWSVCTPVDRVAEVILAAARHVRPGTYFTDGGSTKGNIVAAVQGRLPPGVEYVAAHPLAGSRRPGPNTAGPTCSSAGSPRSSSASSAPIGGGR